MSKGTCIIDGCAKPQKARGWCSMHWYRWRHNGDPHTVAYIEGDDVRRFWSKVDKDGPGGCWLWTTTIRSDGYARFHAQGRDVLAHRYSYELLVGPIPAGLDLDHVYANGCRHRHCVNPAHLEPVTHDENVRRGYEAAREMAS